MIYVFKGISYVKITNEWKILSQFEIEKIKQYVPQALKEIEHLIVVKNEKNNLIGFMGIENTKLEMLFIKDSERGKGIGKNYYNMELKNTILMNLL